MRKRRLLALGLLACLAAGGVAVFWVTTGLPGVTARGFARIQKGTSLEQIEKVLGPANQKMPHDLRLNWMAHNVWDYGDRWGKYTGKCLLWDGDDGSIVVFFDSNMAALGAACLFFPPPTESFPDKLRRWLGLPWW